MNTVIEELVIKVNEDYDNFVFETIRPYCESIIRVKIEKRELAQALLKAQPKHISVVQGHDICPSCHLDITNSVKGMPECYCKRCGQHIIRRWNNET